MSVFHRISDVSVMRSETFVRLAVRLGAYNGAVAARVAEQRHKQPQPKGPAQAPAPRKFPPRYEASSPMANNARTADSAPPATAGALARLNAELGGGWFSYRTAGAAEAAGGDA